MSGKIIIVIDSTQWIHFALLEQQIQWLILDIIHYTILIKNGMMDNIQRVNNCINIPSSQNF
jgi:hypothetical protein